MIHFHKINRQRYMIDNDNNKCCLANRFNCVMSTYYNGLHKLLTAVMHDEN